MTATNPGARRDAYKTAPETDAYQLGYAAGAAAGERLRAAVEALAEPGDPTARMDAYYYGFDRTGVGIIDAILSAVAVAGKGYHHTESWQDEGYGDDKRSHEDRIQDAANTAADRLRAVLATDAQPEPADRRSPDDLLAEAERGSLHVMRWTYEDGGTRAEAVCLAEPGADCRLAGGPDCDCEWWGRIERRDDGTIWHLLTDDYRDLTLPREQEQWHQVFPQDECNVCLFINESGCAEELTPEDDQHTEFVLAEVPFEPVWENDGCSWRPLPARAKTATAELAALRGRVEALADEWDSFTPVGKASAQADELRALLADAPDNTTAGNGGEGRG